MIFFFLLGFFQLAAHRAGRLPRDHHKHCMSGACAICYRPKCFDGGIGPGALTFGEVGGLDVQEAVDGRIHAEGRPSFCLAPIQPVAVAGDQSYKMATSRCVRLMLVGIANQVKEMWIGQQPFLLMAYLWQYAPTWAWSVTGKLGKRRVKNFKAGLVSLQSLSRCRT